MNKKVCGFIVVRRIDAASTFTNDYPRFLKDIPYKGFTRNPFDILCTKYIEKSLPDNILEYYSEGLNCESYVGEYVEDDVLALALLKYSNQLEGEVNELIAFDMQGIEKHNAKLNLEFIGIDIGFYAGSLIYEGIFSKPEMFKKYHSTINKHGLFDNDEIARQYIDDYCLISMDNFHLLEPVSKNDGKMTMRLFKCEI